MIEQTASDHELVGVAFLCIDRLEFLLDHDDTISVVNFSGFPVGSIKLSVKAYIDEVQALPTTIITHVEANIQKFMDHELIINFYFDYIAGLPENHCTDTYISFKFMSHMPTYTTTQYLGHSTDPELESTVQVSRPITAALVDYIRTGCMEFKVFAVRTRPLPPPISPREELKYAEGMSGRGSPTMSSSWRSAGSPASSASAKTSRNASFKGDKAALERKLTQTTGMLESVLVEKRLLKEQMQRLIADYEDLQHENEVLKNDLQSARAEIENMYNISRGDGATIISNHESTMMPTGASRATSFRSSRFLFGRGNSVNTSGGIPEDDEEKAQGCSTVCTIM